jgi:hypothetical protein
MPDDDIVTANTYLHQLGKNPSETLKWDVLADGESINLGMTC